MSEILPPRKKIKLRLRLPKLEEPRKYKCALCGTEDHDIFRGPKPAFPEFCWSCRRSAFRHGPPGWNFRIRGTWNRELRHITEPLISTHIALKHLEYEIVAQER